MVATGGEGGTHYERLRRAGHEALATGNVEQAAEAFGQAARLAPWRPEAHCDLGLAFRAGGRFEAARFAYRGALEIDRVNSTALAGLEALPPEPPGRANFRAGQRLRGGRDGHWLVHGVKQGGFGVVYAVTEEGSGQLRALKTFDARLLWSDEDRRRFEREAVTWLMLDPHPNIVTARWLEYIEGFPCLVMDFAEGGDLGTLLEGGPLEPHLAMQLGLQFCDGMRHAHDQLGLVHRDIKPANCLLSRDGMLMITDFGLARVFGHADGPTVPTAAAGADTTIVGTPSYMAPEQFRPGARLDTRTDVHAFGVLLLCLLTATTPPKRAAEYVEECALPGPLRELIGGCVQPDPGDRPAGFAEVRAWLQDVYRSVVGMPAPPPARASGPVPQDWVDKSLGFRHLGRFDDAVACAVRGLRAVPGDRPEVESQLWHVLGLAQTDRGTHADAMVSFDRALRLDPAEPRLWLSRGAALHRAGRTEEALRCYESGLAHAPKDGHLWLARGRLLRVFGRYDEAERVLRRAARLLPADAEVVYEQAVLWYTIGAHREALDGARAVLRVSPRHTAAWVLRGDVLFTLGDLVEAVAAYDRALEIEPLRHLVLVSKARALGELGRHDEAMACFDRSLRIEETGAAWNGKGLTYSGIGRPAEALACHDRAIELAHTGENWNHRGVALCELGRFDEALACFTRSLQLGPGQAFVWRNKGLVLTRLGSPGAALACYETALRLEPQDAGAREAKEHLQRRLSGGQPQ
ncbi:tetratricopeptide repeat protein [Prauserella endophytica]|uniref:Tetratricopeptide repeat protein n=1 Tax=Prauserella endophytica TaxID=1592324 RepID=A0ABY2RYG8_9PSEU|nr:tetratricopeptide repeat protein [Prauserella endophytica]TKG65726.1 tetratricopeptide repeat protein [Prauserella endophytica]